MLYLDSYDVAPVDIQPRLHFRQKNSKPVADCFDVIWGRWNRVIGILLFIKNKDKDT